VIPGVSSKYMSNSETGMTFKTKIFLPRFQGINYVGLIIGPKGIYQKKLEDKTGCKILIRGKGSHKDGHPMSQNDNDDQHVLIIGDKEEKLVYAKELVQQVLTADETTRNKIRSEQLKDAQDLSKNVYKHEIEDFMLTPYGPPSPYAVIIAIPNECVGLIIGKGGDTIRHL
jgi:far upstream element-binding protein